MTRNSLIHQFHLRPASLYGVIQQLKSENLLIEPNRTTVRTGRKPSLIALNPDYAQYLGIEIRSDCLIGVVIDAQGTRVDQMVIKWEGMPDVSKVHAHLLEMVRDFRSKHSHGGSRKIHYVGLADAGIVDSARGLSLKAVHITGWELVEIRDWMTHQTGIPSHVMSANNARAFAEYVLSDGEKPESLLHLELDFGIGAGFIRAGELFGGFNGCALEVGHLIIQEDGPYCSCGNRGCLEALIGKAGLQKRLAEFQNQYGGLVQSEFSYKAFAQAIQFNEKVAHRVLMETVLFFGSALSSVITLLNPQRILLSGGLTCVGEYLLVLLNQQLALRCLSQSLSGLEITISTCDEMTTACGAALF
ncbi:MAG: ROK family protein, partial [Patescibacteria group bacterium]